MAKKTKRIKEYLSNFNIAGFTYYDGPEAFKYLELGLLLDLKPEPDNPYDPQAVMIFHEDFQLGYIPQSENSIFFKLLRVGFTKIEVRIQQINPTASPENQVMVVAHLIG